MLSASAKVTGVAKNRRESKLPAPFLKRLNLRAEVLAEKSGYPFNLPWAQDPEFELNFTAPVVILVE